MAGTLRDFLLQDYDQEGTKKQKESILDFDPVSANKQLDEIDAAIERRRSQKEVKLVSSIPTIESKTFGPGPVMHSANVWAKTTLNTLADMLESVVGVANLGLEFEPEEAGYERTIARRKALDNFMPSAQKYNDSFFMTDMPAAMGSIGAFYMGGIAGATAKLPVWAGSAVIGAGAGSQSLGTEAYEATKNLDTAGWAKLIGAGIGATEAIPISRGITRANKMVGTILKGKGGSFGKNFTTFLNNLSGKDIAKDALKEGSEEFVQEFFQTTAENMTAKELWDASREVFDGSLRGGAAGFLSGMMMSALFGIGSIKSHSDLNKADKEVVADAGELLKTMGSAVDNSTPEKTEDNIVAGATNRLFHTLLSAGNIAELNLDTAEPEAVAAAQEVANTNFSQILGETITEMTDVGNPNFLHAALRFNKNYYQEVLNQLEDKDKRYKLAGVNNEKMAGMSPKQFDTYTKNTYDTVVAQATSDNIQEKLNLPAGLEEEAYNDFVVAAALNIKSPTLELIPQGYPKTHPDILRDAVEAVKVFNDPNIQTNANVAYTKSVYDSKQDLGDMIRDEQARPIVDEQTDEIPAVETNKPNTPIAEDLVKPGSTDTKGGSLQIEMLFEEAESIPSLEPFVWTQQSGKVGDVFSNEVSVCHGTCQMVRTQLEKIGLPVGIVDIGQKDVFGKTDKIGDHRVAITEINGERYIVDFPQNKMFTPLEKPELNRGYIKTDLFQPMFIKATVENIDKYYGEDTYPKISLHSINSVKLSKALYEEGQKEPINPNKATFSYGEMLADFQGTTAKELQSYFKKQQVEHMGFGALFNYLSEKLPDTQIQVGQMNLTEKGAMPKGGYAPSSNTVQINTAVRTQRPHELVATATHEMLHAYTLDFIKANTLESQAFIAKIEQIRKSLRVAVDKGLINSNVNVSTITPHIKIAKTEAEQVRQISEFISYAFGSDSSLRSVLINLPHGGKVGKSLFARFIDAIRSIFNKAAVKNQTLMEELAKIMDEYIPNIDANLGVPISSRSIFQESLKQSEISTERTAWEDDSWMFTNDKREMSTEKQAVDEDTTDDDSIELSTLKGFDNLMATTAGISLAEYYKNFREGATYERLIKYIEILDAKSNDRITNRLKDLYNQTYKNKGYNFDTFVKQFLTAKLIRIKDLKQKNFISMKFTLGTDEFNERYVKPSIEHHGGEQFKTPQGTLRSTFDTDVLIDTAMGPLATILGLNEGQLQIARINDFTTIRKYSTYIPPSSKSIKRLKKSDMGAAGSNLPISRILEGYLRPGGLQDQYGNNFLYLGNFGGNNTMPVIKLAPGVFELMAPKLQEFLDIYNEAKGTDFQLRDNLSSLTRLVLEDMWNGAITLDGKLNIEKSVVGQDMNKLFKRGSRWTFPLASTIQSEGIFKDLSRGSDPFVPSTKEASIYKGIRLDEQGQIQVNTLAINSKDLNLAALLDGTEENIVEAEEEIKQFFTNSLGTSRIDGATFYVIDEFDKVYKRIHGALKDGALKNVYISSIGDAPLFIKHAMHGVSRQSYLGQLMLNNRIGLLAADESTKIINDDAISDISDPEGILNNAFEIPIAKFYRDKEEQNNNRQVKALKQVYNGSSAGATYNPAMKKADTSGKFDSAIKEFVTKASIELENFHKNMTDDKFFDKTLKSIKNPTSYRERILSDAFAPLIVGPDNEVKERFAALVQDPSVSETLRNSIKSINNDALSNRTEGARVALNPNIGNADRFQQVIPVEKAIKTRIARLPSNDATFKELVPDDKVRAAIKSYYAWQRKLSESDARVEKQRNTTGFNIAKNNLKDLGYKTPVEAINITDEQLQEQRDKVLDPKTGMLNDGYAIISPDVAEAHNIKPGDKLITIITPTDSMLGVSVAEVAGIALPQNGEKVIDNRKAILNSEYIQSMVGKDFDIDTIALIPYNDTAWTPETWDIVTKTLENVKEAYINMMVTEYNKLFRATKYPTIQTPDGEIELAEITKAGLFDNRTMEPIMVAYAQELLGTEESELQAGERIYNALGPDFHDLSDKYLIDPSLIITQRRRHTALSAINFKIDGLEVRHSKWARTHLLHLIMTNHSVDAPSNTSLFRYNGNLSKDTNKLSFFRNFWDLPPREDSELDGMRRMAAVDAITGVLFGRSFSILNDLDEVSREGLDLFSQASAILEQQKIFEKMQAIKDKSIGYEKYAEEIAAAAYDRVSDNYKKKGSALTIEKLTGMVLTMEFDKIKDYPLFDMFSKVNPYDWAWTGMTFQQYTQVEAKTILDTLRLYPEFNIPSLQREAIDADSIVLATERLLFDMDNNSGLVLDKKTAVALARGLDEEIEVGKAPKTVKTPEGEVEVEKIDYIKSNYKARGKAFPTLFRLLLQNSKIEFKYKAKPYSLTFNNKLDYNLTIDPRADGSIRFLLSTKQNPDVVVYTSNEVLDPSDTVPERKEGALALNQYLLQDKPGSIANRREHRFALSKMFSLQSNTAVDDRKAALDNFIQNRIYEKGPGRYTREQVKIFWFSSIGQLQDIDKNKARENFIINRATFDPNSPLKFQANTAFKELFGKYEETLFRDYMEMLSQSIVASNQHKDSIQKELPKLSGEMYYEDSLENIADTHSTENMKSHLFGKYGQDIKASDFTKKEYRRFKKILRTQGYNAGYRELQKLAEELATKMALVENGQFAATIQQDLKTMSPSVFRSTYGREIEGHVERAIERNKAAALKRNLEVSGKFVKRYDLDLKPETDQDLNNLEAIFYILDKMKKPYNKASQPTNAEALNKIFGSIHSFAYVGPRDETKNFAFINSSKAIIDSRFDPRNISGVKEITMTEFQASSKEYLTSDFSTLGEASLGIVKGELLDRTLKTYNAEMKRVVEDIEILTDFSSQENRMNYIEENRRSAETDPKTRFLVNALENYGDEKIDGVTETGYTFELSENLKDRYGIYIEMLGSEAAKALGIESGIGYRYKDSTMVWGSAEDLINDIWADKTGREKIRLLGALEYRGLYDIYARVLLSRSEKYLDTLANRFIQEYNDPVGAKVIDSLIARFRTYYTDLGAGTGLPSDKVYGNYMPHQYSEVDRDSISRKSEHKKALDGLRKQVQFHKAAVREGLPSADPQLAQLTDEQVQELARREAEQALIAVKVNTAPTTTNPFMNRRELKDNNNYKKTDYNVHYNYIGELTKSIHNDILSAEAIVFKSRATAAGNSASLIESGLEWYADQTSNPFLRSKAVEIEKLRKGAEVNFYVWGYGVAKDHHGEYGVTRTPVVVSGNLEKTDGTTVKIFKNIGQINRDAAVKIEHYVDLGERLRARNQDYAITDDPMYGQYYTELSNLHQYGYVSLEEMGAPDTNLELLQLMAKVYNRILQDPSLYGTYNRENIFVEDNAGKIYKGTHLKRNVMRGSLGLWEAIARESRNSDVIDGMEPTAMTNAIYWGYKGFSKMLDIQKKALNWMVMGHWTGAPAAVTNLVGGYSMNRMDSWRQNSKYAREWRSIYLRLKETPYQRLSADDQHLYDALSSAGIMNKQGLQELSLGGANIVAEDLLLSESFTKSFKELSDAINEGLKLDYKGYQARVQELKKELVDAEIAENYELASVKQAELYKESLTWKAKIEGILGAEESLTPEKQREVEAAVNNGTLTKSSLAEKHNVTPGQALYMMAKIAGTKIYSSPILGVGLQRKAEIQRSAAYGIAYLRAKEYGYSNLEADRSGLRAIERNHALYDNAHKQKAANTVAGKVLFMYSQYKYNSFIKYLKQWQQAIPQFIKHKKRLKSWSDWPSIWANVKQLFKKDIDLTSQNVTELEDKKNIPMKDVNISNFLFMRTAVSLIAVQIGSGIFYGLANSVDPVSQATFDLVDQLIGVFDDDEELDQDTIWAITSALYWTGLPISMGIQAPMTAIALDWDTALQQFSRGRFGLQGELATKRFPATLQRVGYLMGITDDRLKKDEKTLFDPWVFDKLLGIKLLGWSKLDNTWINYEDRFPLAFNPINWIPWKTIELR